MNMSKMSKQRKLVSQLQSIENFENVLVNWGPPSPHNIVAGTFTTASQILSSLTSAQWDSIPWVLWL